MADDRIDDRFKTYVTNDGLDLTGIYKDVVDLKHTPNFQARLKARNDYLHSHGFPNVTLENAENKDGKHLLSWTFLQCKEVQVGAILDVKRGVRLPRLTDEQLADQKVACESKETEVAQSITPKEQIFIDAIQRVGEGPWQAAKRLLGPDALSADINHLTQQLKHHYQIETRDQTDNMEKLTVGHQWITEANFDEIVNNQPTLKARYERLSQDNPVIVAAALTEEQAAKLTKQDFPQLDLTEVKSNVFAQINGAAFAGMTTDQALKLTPGQGKILSKAQFANIPKSVIGKIDAGFIANICPETFAGLTPEQGFNLNTEQAEALSFPQLHSVPWLQAKVQGSN